VKASINIQLDDVTGEELSRFLWAMHGDGTAPLTITSYTGDGAEAALKDEAAPEPTPDQTPEPVAEKPTKAKRGRPRKDAEKEEEVASASDETPKTTDAPKASENDVKKAIQSLVQSKGIETVRKLVSTFKNAKGEPATKLSDLQERDYAEIVGALNAAGAE